MSLVARLVPRSGKGIALTSIFGLLFLVAAWQGLRAWWWHGFSRGERTGLIRKFSYKGSPLCKFWSGELVVVGSSMTNPEVWVFTTDASRDDDPIIKDIQAAQATARPATLKYRQDKKKWWACASGDTEYYVTSVEKK